MKEETICAWIELNKLNAYSVIFSYATPTYFDAIAFDLRPSDTVGVGISNKPIVFNNVPFFSTSNQVGNCLSCIKMS